ncbi:MAG: hypothetical protein J5781_07960 [Clostridia bacterium]|nr:hypothetical protein [Clostridia bacterium]
MKIFGKKLSGKEQKMLLLRLIFILLSGALLLFFSIYSFAWFSKNSNVTSTGMRLVVSTDTYDVLVERGTTYDSGHEYITESGKLKSLLANAGYSLSDTSTADSTSIAYELVNEYSFDGHYYLMPGSYGTVSFYIRPKVTNANVSARFALNLGGYKSVITQNENDVDIETMSAVTSESVLNMLRGHILFFTERTTVGGQYQYDGLIDDGTFSYDTNGKTKSTDPGKTDCYKVTLYWEWPITYDSITDNISTASVTKKYPEELADYLNNHREYFFAVNVTGNNPEEMIDAYNDGDQTIGDGMVAFVVYINAQ